MWPFPNPLDLFGDALGEVTGWAWEKVIQGIYTWFANGLLLLMEWVWGVLDTATTPRLTEVWFTEGMVRPIAGISLAITVAMMLASAVQAGFGGRPELIIDAIKEGPKAIAATAITVVVMDAMIRGGDAIADVVWQSGRAEAQQVLDGLAATMVASGGLATTFLGPLALLFGMIGLLVTTVVLFMRSSMLYLVAAFAPIVWASSVSPVMRGSGRRLVHVTVALVLAKPAISITLVVGVRLLAAVGTPGPEGADGAAALGTLLSGFTCFAIAGLSPWVVYRLLPSVEGAAVSSGVMGGWGRSAMTAVQVGMMAKSFGASGAASAATRALPEQAASTGGAAAGLASVAPTSGGSTGQSGPSPRSRSGSTGGWSPTAASTSLQGSSRSRPGLDAPSSDNGARTKDVPPGPVGPPRRDEGAES
ncbi:MAG: hypothetical protein AAB131_09055 [Actinomycetota bacterium]